MGTKNFYVRRPVTSLHVVCACGLEGNVSDGMQDMGETKLQSDC